MTLRLATWNINSVRHREQAVLRFLREEGPDVLCLQETKTPVEKFPLDGLRALGYDHVVVRGEKAYNGVAILSRLPLEHVPHRDFCTRGDARHVAARLPSGAVVHNLYIPAGGDLPDPALNPKFAHKLDFLAELRAWFAETPPERAILVGDLNVAPREDDVWSHKQLLGSSRTPPSRSRPSPPRRGPATGSTSPAPTSPRAASTPGGPTAPPTGRPPTRAAASTTSGRPPTSPRAPAPAASPATCAAGTRPPTTSPSSPSSRPEPGPSRGRRR